MKYFDSSNIKVFPTSKRDDTLDRNARLNSEQNLIQIINRLTDIKSFVIDGLDFYTDTNDNYVMRKGSCNINGYYFEITEDTLASNFVHTTNSNDLYFYINLSLSANNGTIFTELLGNDEAEGDDAGNYLGLNIGIGTTPADEPSGDPAKFYLKIGTWDSTNNKWITAINRTLKYNHTSVTLDDGILE